jgi:DNA-binding HxlR family transcriptional regulator
LPQETISRSSLGLHSFERASRLIGDHWTLLIVRELTMNKCLTFTELMVAVRGISTNIVSQRLHQLACQRVVTVDQSSADGRKQFYSLTSIGAGLRPIIRSIDRWGRKFDGNRGHTQMNSNPRQRSSEEAG